MNGREFGEALFRQFTHNNDLARIMMGFTDDQHAVIGVLEDAIRAALASKDAGPRQGEIGPDDGTGTVLLTREEVTRLRAWERWAREHAKPALLATYRNDSHVISERALAAVPLIGDSP